MGEHDPPAPRRRVELCDPDPDWRAAYERERLAIETALAGLGRVCMEHIGSTAIGGIRAKPIIDMMVGVDTYDWLDKARLRLESLGYEYDEYALNDDPAGTSSARVLRIPLAYERTISTSRSSAAPTGSGYSPFATICVRTPRSLENTSG